MIYLFTTLFMNHLLTVVPFNISWQEIAALLSVVTAIGGGFIKIIQRSNEKLRIRVDMLEKDLKEKIIECKDHISEVERKVSDDREKDVFNRDRAMEKIESRIEKLSDLIIKLIEKN